MKNKSFKVKVRQAPPLVRLIRRIIIDENGCWVWQGHRNKGYAYFYDGKKKCNAYRWIYEQVFGKVKEGLELDHLCRNRACVNPIHLEEVTTRENCLRGESLAAKRARQTHCIRGHKFTKDNTSLTKQNQRRCLKCHALRERRRKGKI